MSKMRINLGQIIVITMLVLAGAGAFLFGYTLEERRDEAAIKSLVTGLADNLSKTETESTASALIKVKAVADAFADPMTLAMDKYAFGDYDRDRVFINDDICANAKGYERLAEMRMRKGGGMV